MNNNEQFRARLVSGLSDVMDADTLQRALRVIDDVTNRYDITERTTALSLADSMPDAVKMYIAAKAVENKAKRTLQEYKNVLICFFGAVKKALPDITTNDIRLYLYKYKELRNVKDSRIEMMRVILNSFFEWNVQEGMIPLNPARRIAVIKCAKAERHPMSLLDLEKVRCACQNIREKAIVDFLFSTGCRVSETVNVRLEDVDFQTGTVIIWHGKGDKERRVYLNAECMLSLQMYLGQRKGVSEYLFCVTRRPYGQVIIKSIERMVKKIGKRAGISIDLTPHVFRHTAATVAIRNGMPVEQVRQMLGHESLDTTLIYAKTDDSLVRMNHQRCVS